MNRGPRGAGARRRLLPRVAACAVCLGILAPGWPGLAQSQSGLVATLDVRLEAGGHTQPLVLPAWEASGDLYLPLQAAAEYLGLEYAWYGTKNKAAVWTASGHKAVLTLAMPTAVVDGQRMIRLPRPLKFVQGGVAVTPETLLDLLQALGEESLLYVPESRTLKAAAPEHAAGRARVPARVAPVPWKLRCVVVDPGHGGRDPGAVGPSGLKEKTVTLEIARQLAKLLEERCGCEVILTRSDDRFIALDQRAQIANEAKADLFVSIHANASRDRKASGSQVFIYNREASSGKAAETAALENSDSNYLEMIKDDLRQSAHEADSITAAGLISQQLEKRGLDTRRIERAPFYVLAKSHIPSILVETAFISHPGEERKLRSRRFLAGLAAGIFTGIQGYAADKRRGTIGP